MIQNRKTRHDRNRRTLATPLTHDNVGPIVLTGCFDNLLQGRNMENLLQADNIRLHAVELPGNPLNFLCV